MKINSKKITKPNSNAKAKDDAKRDASDLKESILTARNFNDLNTLNNLCIDGDQAAIEILGSVWKELLDLGFLSVETVEEIRKVLKKQLDISLEILLEIIKNGQFQLQKLATKKYLEITQHKNYISRNQELFKVILAVKNLKFLDYITEIFKTEITTRFLKFLKELLDQLHLLMAGSEARPKKKILENLRDYKIILENSFYILLNLPKNSQDKFRKVYSDAWLALLSHEMDYKTLKKVLKDLDTELIPNLQDPRLLADFLVDSYNQGGVLAILALNGLFILITRYDLEYPNFYEKLYVLLDSAILHSKFKSRFFSLVNIFLSSSLLPVNLVAGFIKKLARLALFAPPSGISIILPIIYNLLRSHHKCISMIHNTDTASSLETWDPTQTDPVKSGALESSLWELSTLDRHYHFQIKKEISKFTSPLLSNQKVSEFLYESYDSFALKSQELDQIVVDINLQDSIF